MHRPRKGLIRALLQFSSEKSDNEASPPLSVSFPLDDDSRSHQSFGMSFPGLHSIPMHHLTFDLAENTGLSADSFEGFGSRGFHSPLAAIYPFMHFRPETVPHSLVPRSIARWNTLVEHSAMMEPCGTFGNSYLWTTARTPQTLVGARNERKWATW